MSEENKEVRGAEGTVDEILTEEVMTEETADKNEPKMSFNKQEKTDRPYWYVVYTYSGYENKVMTNLIKPWKTRVLRTVFLMSRFPWRKL